MIHFFKVLAVFLFTHSFQFNAKDVSLPLSLFMFREFCPFWASVTEALFSPSLPVTAALACAGRGQPPTLVTLFPSWSSDRGPGLRTPRSSDSRLPPLLLQPLIKAYVCVVWLLLPSLFCHRSATIIFLIFWHSDGIFWILRLANFLILKRENAFSIISWCCELEMAMYAHLTSQSSHPPQS